MSAVRKTAKSAAPTVDDVVAGVRITHPERVVFASPGITKLDLARYYESVAGGGAPGGAGGAGGGGGGPPRPTTRRSRARCSRRSRDGR